MIARTGALLVALALLAGCTGTDQAGSTASAGASGSSVTVTRTVTASPTVSTVPLSPTTPGPARCDVPALTVSVADAQGAAGSTYRNLVFRNGGEQACFLRGFPGVSAADAAGKALVDASRDTARPAVRVVLDPGQAAHAQLAMRNIPPDAKPCPTYPTLLVTPPDSRRTQSVTVDVKPCGAHMSISVVLPGAA